jgi:hypothetical protein
MGGVAFITGSPASNGAIGFNSAGLSAKPMNSNDDQLEESS